jgi:hypothetical protein
MRALLKRRGRAVSRLLVATTIVAGTAMMAPTAAHAADTTPPTANFSLDGEGNFSGSAQDAVGVTGIEFALQDPATKTWLQADGTWKAQFRYLAVSPLDPYAPGAVRWDIELPVGCGRWGFMARARDAAGNFNVFRPFSPIEIMCDHTWPTATLITPQAITTPQTVTAVTGTASDNIGVGKVEVAIQRGDKGPWLKPDGTWTTGFAWVQATLAAPGAPSTSWSLPVTFTVAGVQHLQARVVDVYGLTTVFQPRMAFFIGAAAGTVTTPAPDGTLSDPGTISGTAADVHRVVYVDVAVRRASTNQWLKPNGTWAAGFAWNSATLSAPNTVATDWSFVLDAPAPGTYNLQVRMRDSRGDVTVIREYSTFTVV